MTDGPVEPPEPGVPGVPEVPGDPESVVAGDDPEFDPEEPGYSPVPVSGKDIPDTPPGLEMSLGEVRDWLRARVEKGVFCPACEQFAKVYRRRIYAGMVRALILMYREGDFGRRLYVHVPSIDPARGGDVAKLEFWGLIEEERTVRTDGGRAGYWRVTRRGEDWIGRKVAVPKYARIYDGRLLSLSGDLVTVDDALGEVFRLDELMEGV